MKNFIFSVGTTNWGVQVPHELIIYCSPFMYCVFHHIPGHFPRQIWFWKFSTKLGLRSDPPAPCWAKCPTFSEKEFWWPSLKFEEKSYFAWFSLFCSVCISCEQELLFSTLGNVLRSSPAHPLSLSNPWLPRACPKRAIHMIQAICWLIWSQDFSLIKPPQPLIVSTES